MKNLNEWLKNCESNVYRGANLSLNRCELFEHRQYDYSGNGSPIVPFPPQSSLVAIGYGETIEEAIGNALTCADQRNKR